jgi:hypothetical protein
VLSIQQGQDNQRNKNAVNRSVNRFHRDEK